MTAPVRRLRAELLATAGAALGEAPHWDARHEALVWVDIFPGSVHLTSASGRSIADMSLDRAVGAALPAADGGWLLADATGFSRLAEDGRVDPLLPFLADRPGLRCNDAKCDRLGRAWAGIIAGDMAPGSGSLHRLDAGPAAPMVLDGCTVANGIGWSPDDRTLWFADSADRSIRGFDYDLATGTLGERRHAIELAPTPGVADGLCVDDEGGVWVGLWDGGAVHRYLPDGRLDMVVELPVARVTSCAFGGPDLATLFITTARIGLTPDELAQAPRSGDLFVVRAGVSGPPATPWRTLPPIAPGPGGR